MEHGGFLNHAFPIVRTVVKFWYVPFATLLMTTQPLLTSSTRSLDGSYLYSVLGVTLMSECVKLLVSCVMYAMLSREAKSHNSLGVRDVVEFGVPALIYFVNNNLVFLIIQRLSSSQFQILSCFKTVFTALLFRIMLRKTLSVNKWAAVSSLTAGAASIVIHNSCSFLGEEDASGESIYDDTSLAVVGTLASCLLSSLAGVYNEVLLKKDYKLHSLHLQNTLLYAWGTLFNTAGLFAFDSTKIIENGFFYGYDWKVVILIINNAATGLVISAILKLCNNIVRVFAHTAAMVATAFIEVAFIQSTLTPQIPLSIIIVTSSSVSYAADGPLRESPQTRVFLERSRTDDVEFETR